jgi:hypothetical protein
MLTVVDKSSKCDRINSQKTLKKIDWIHWKLIEYIENWSNTLKTDRLYWKLTNYLFWKLIDIFENWSNTLKTDRILWKLIEYFENWLNTLKTDRLHILKIDRSINFCYAWVYICASNACLMCDKNERSSSDCSKTLMSELSQKKNVAQIFLQDFA